MTMRNLVTLNLESIPPFAYFHLKDLLQQISLMPELKIIQILFCPHSKNPSGYSDIVKRELLHVPIMTHVTLPNLRWFGFAGVSAYLEMLLPWVNFPALEKLQIYFFNQPASSITHLQQYISNTWNFSPITITVNFNPYCFCHRR